MPITVGVPQSSVLGPFLFLVYINDFANCFEDAQLVLHADDVVLVNKSTTLSALMAKTQANLNAAIEWTRSNALALNSNKIKFVIFAYTSDYTYPNIKINIGEIAIYPLETFNYLGVIIDSQLKRKEHTKLVTKTLGVSCSIVNKIKNYLPLDILKNIYYSITYPHLQYGITTWGNATKKCLSKVQVMQNRLIEIMTKSNHRKTKLSPIYARLSVLR